MSHAHRFTLIAASMAALMPGAAYAQKDLASCKPVLEAFEKQTTVPYHMFDTTSSAVPGGKPRQGQLISTGGHHYLMVGGKWVRSPMTPAETLEQEQDNVRDAKAYSCRQPRSALTACTVLAPPKVSTRRQIHRSGSRRGPDSSCARKP